MSEPLASSSRAVPRPRARQPHSDIFRPRFPLDPFAAAAAREPWLVQLESNSAPVLRRDVILVLGAPSAQELAPLLSSAQLAASLVILATHECPDIPPHVHPCVRILRLPAPLSIHDAGAVRLVGVLEWAERVGRVWRACRSRSDAVLELADDSDGHTARARKLPPADPAQRPLDAVLNFLPKHAPDTALLKHAILVTTITRPFLVPAFAGARRGHARGGGGEQVSAVAHGKSPIGTRSRLSVSVSPSEPSTDAEPEPARRKPRFSLTPASLSARTARFLSSSSEPLSSSSLSLSPPRPPPSSSSPSSSSSFNTNSRPRSRFLSTLSLGAARNTRSLYLPPTPPYASGDSLPGAVAVSEEDGRAHLVHLTPPHPRTKLVHSIESFLLSFAAPSLASPAAAAATAPVVAQFVVPAAALADVLTAPSVATAAVPPTSKSHTPSPSSSASTSTTASPSPSPTPSESNAQAQAPLTLLDAILYGRLDAPHTPRAWLAGAADVRVLADAGLPTISSSADPVASSSSPSFASSATSLASLAPPSLSRARARSAPPADSRASQPVASGSGLGTRPGATTPGFGAVHSRLCAGSIPTPPASDEGGGDEGGEGEGEGESDVDVDAEESTLGDAPPSSPAFASATPSRLSSLGSAPSTLRPASSVMRSVLSATRRSISTSALPGRASRAESVVSTVGSVGTAAGGRTRRRWRFWRARV